MDRETDQRGEESYYELVTRFQSRLFAFISALLAGDGGASDVLQETNVVLWEKASSYNPESSFAAWAYRVAHYQVMAYRKRQQRDRRLVFNDDLVSTLVDEFQDDDDYDDSLSALQSCLGKLAQPHRLLVRQRYEQNRSVSDLAASMGQKANSVAATLYRIRKVLLDCVERALRTEGVQ